MDRNRHILVGESVANGVIILAYHCALQLKHKSDPVNHGNASYYHYTDNKKALIFKSE